MNIDAQTKVRDLVETYPHIMDWLVTYAPEFTKLKNPVLYNTVARVATLETAAAMANAPLDSFLDDVRTEIARREIAAEELRGASGRDTGGGGTLLDEAERSDRQEVLKSIIHRLHDGESVEQVKADFDALVTNVDSAEIARMEQALIAEGTPVEEVQRLCDVHVTVFKESLDAHEESPVAAGHPVDAYRRENETAGEIVSSLRRAVDALAAARDADARTRALGDLGTGLERLAQIDIHYTRKEHQLFPVLERHGVEGPTKVMWGLDDDIRGRIKSARALAQAGDAAALAVSLIEILGMIDDMIYKEEKILFPTALQVVTAEEWDAMAAGDADIGYAWVGGPAADVKHAVETPSPPATAAVGKTADDTGVLLPLTTGALALEQLDLMLRSLPFDVTYVDENDRVRFYSEGDRVFPRSPAAIGREVRNCHPPKSVDKVEQILSEFKAGTKDVAEFWIELGGRFVHIRYFALRDSAGAYRGCLEVVQDATHVRGLTGQRRLLDW